MKKIFTLIATALFAVGAQAQDAETVLFTNGATYVDGQSVTSASTSLTLSADLQKSWTVSPVSFKGDFLKPFSQQVEVEDEDTGEKSMKDRLVKIVGKQNPKDKVSTSTSSAGSGINCAEGKATANLPQSGTYYIIKTEKAGKVAACVELNADKAFYLIDATEAKADETATYMQVELPGANLQNYVFKNSEGTAVEMTDDSEAKGGKIVAEKTLGVVEFDAEAGHTYYMFCTGSKLGMVGYIFTPSSSAPAEPEIWTVAGTQPLVDNSWDPADANAEMKTTDGVNYTYVKEDIVLEKGTNYQFKVVKGHAWGEEYPSSNYEFSVNETAKYTVTVTFNAESKEVAANAVKTGEAQAVEHTYSVIGTINGNWDTDTDMTKGEDGVYTAVFEDVAAGSYKFKVRQDHDWGVAYPSSDYALTVDVDGSTVTVTFNGETQEVKAEVAAPSAINSVKAGKTAAVRYNLAGQKVNASYQGVVIENGKKMIQK